MCRSVVLLATLLWSMSAVLASPWIYSNNEDPPEGTIRITVLGSGTPDVRRHQVIHRRLAAFSYTRNI